MPVNEKILGPKSEEEKEVFEAEAKKFERELAEHKEELNKRFETNLYHTRKTNDVS